ncbi:MAG: amidohydrolase family protein [Candidatus Caldarchaeum sp.]|nr:amidohydrolase family protein [Candidatus Caldarchaeum sp.]MDW8359129.1 amidohydrolase family protein [Candidatus Caldarchaeum sp.]
MVSTIIHNIGKLVSGDWNRGVLNADAIRIENGLIKNVGGYDEVRKEGADVVVDVNGMTVIPGLIDPHTHLSFGDFSPMQHMVGLLTETLLQGTTTIIDEWLQFEGLPLFYGADVNGVKATALLSLKAYQNYRPGGAMKVFAGSIMLVEGLTKQDLAELRNQGVWRVGQIGGSTNIRDERIILQMVSWARELGYFVSTNLGPGVLPESLNMTPELVSAIKPDKIAHINGGTTAPPWDVVKRAIDGTGDCKVEIIPYGNLKMAMRVFEYLKNTNQLHRLVVGSDTPTGQGYLPVAIHRSILFLSSVCGLDADKAIASATGNVADCYGKYYSGFNVGKIEPGRAADLVVIDSPPGSVGNDALEAIQAGDMIGVAGVFVDGNLVGLRGKDSRPSRRNIKLNEKDLKVTCPDEYLFDPPRFYYRSTGPTYLL